MNSRRNINVDNIAGDGYLIGRFCRFSLFLMGNGLMRLVDDNTGIILCDLTMNDMDTIHDIANIAKTWNRSHRIIHNTEV